MPFITFCTNKGCRKEMAPVIDKKTKKVHCCECDSELEIDQFMKSQLISMGQVKVQQEVKSAFSIVCPLCKERKTPYLNGNIISCSSCNKDITSYISAPFVQMLKSELKTNK